MPDQHVEIELRRDRKLPLAREDGLDEQVVVENGVAGVGVGEELRETHGIGAGTGERPHDESEVFGGEPVAAVGANQWIGEKYTHIDNILYHY